MHFYTATCRRSLSVFIFTEKQAQVENSLQANRNSFLVFLAKRVQVSQDSVGLSTKVNWQVFQTTMQLFSFNNWKDMCLGRTGAKLRFPTYSSTLYREGKSYNESGPGVLCWVSIRAWFCPSDI